MTTTVQPDVNEVTQPTFSVDEWSFHHFLAEMTGTNQLFIGTVAEVIRERAAERGLTIPRKVTNRYVERSGKMVGAGADTHLTKAGADFIEAAVMNVMAAIVEAVDAEAAR